MEKKTGGTPTETPKKSPDTKSKSNNASPNVKIAGKIPGSSNASTPKTAPATAPQSIDAQMDRPPRFYELVPETLYQFGLASNPESAYTDPNIDRGLVVPKKMYQEARLPFNPPGTTTKLARLDTKDKNVKVLVPYERNWVFFSSNRQLQGFMTRPKASRVPLSSQAATTVVRDNQGKNDLYWIKCTSLEVYFKDISMEINILNTLSQDPEGRRFFPRVLFYNYYNGIYGRRLLFGCPFFDMSLLNWLRDRAEVGINLHLIRCIMKQMLEAVLVLRKYGITNTSEFHPGNIRMKGKSKVEIVVVNFNRATIADHTPDFQKDAYNQYTPTDYVFEFENKKKLWEEWSVAAMAYEMLVGRTHCIPLAATTFRKDLVFSAFELLGAPKMEMAGLMRIWYRKKKIDGKLVLRTELKEEKDKYLQEKYIRFSNLPKSIEDLRKIRPDFYKTLDQRTDLNQLVDVIVGMFSYDPNTRTTAEQALQFPFFDLKKNKCNIWYSIEAEDVYAQDTQVIARLSLQSTSKEAGH